MREIKFRGRRVNGGEWVESMTISRGTIKRKQDDIFFELSEGQWVGVERETVGQFTGLKDCEGKPIYEGDVVRLAGFKHPAFEIRFLEGNFIADPIGCSEYNPLQDLSVVHCKIIGSIHEQEGKKEVEG